MADTVDKLHPANSLMEHTYAPDSPCAGSADAPPSRAENMPPCGKGAETPHEPAAKTVPESMAAGAGPGAPLAGLTFLQTLRFPRGLIFDLLQDAYSFDPHYAQYWQANWRDTDDFLFSNPSIAEKYSFVTALHGEPIGFIVWDPRNLPSYAVIGHNCIRALHKGNGYGKRQLQEAIRRIGTAGAGKAIVTTNEGLVSAQKNYERCGFRLVGKRPNADNPEIAGAYMDYELDIAGHR